MEQHLHVFMSIHREELLSMVTEKMKQASRRADLGDSIQELFDQIVDALKRGSGIPAISELPGKSEVAVQLGADRQRRAFPIAELALHIGTISDSIGELGTRYGLSFPAEEYRLFNQCIDSIMATAAEEFAVQLQEAHESEAVERVGFIAHELRNALGTARMSFDVLRSGQMGFGSRTAEVHERALTRLQQLIEQMLLDARLHSRVSQRLVPVQLEKLLLEVTDAIPRERDVRVTVSVDPELQLVTDERLLISAVSNLVQNAIKFTREGGLVEVRATRDKDYTITIEVEDECGGLPPGSVERLFEAHVQAGRERRGFGLGLAITRQAVERLGGEVVVRDLQGKGCIFGLRFAKPTLSAT